MRFNVDLIPGDLLSFEEIARRYAIKFPEEKELTARALLSPSTSYRNLVIRAVFANDETNSPLEDLLFISNDNERKNYLRRMEHYLKLQLPFFYFRRTEQAKLENRWKVMGESRVYAMLDPASAAAQNLINSRGYRLALMRQEGEEGLWQLFDPQAHACFTVSRRIQFIVVLTSPLHSVPAGVIAGTQVGRQVKTRVWQRASQAEFAAAVKARYGGCVITGTPLAENAPHPWVEACHIDTTENEDGFLHDNGVDNGLFLRSDLLRLFINRLLTIDSDSGVVQLRQGMPLAEDLSVSYQHITGKVCALWPQVPQATREKLRFLL
ncbi:MULTISPECIES: HNH endonuclease signature motif containing protein [Erwinia]|uniref:HNH endonuclease signature motif containing protein n=1 Tax=Erwinia TaxID=551 RepID=UPI000551EC76|nr:MULTISPECIES: HNH endonuclease signature motif containing protein [Erwinia]